MRAWPRDRIHGGRRVLWAFALGIALVCGLSAAIEPARAEDLALGDSLALGFGRASHMRTLAVVGEPSCPNGRRRGILNMVPPGHFNFVLLSAGTNDPPGRCVEAIRARLNADCVMWVVPVNGARPHVLQVAARHGDALLYYTPGKGKVWPHPPRYWNVRR